MRFEYTTHPTRLALVMTGVLALCAVIVPVLLFRVIFLAFAAGPGSWALIQWLRRGHGVQIQDDGVQIPNPLLARTRCIPFSIIRGYALTPGKGLAVAYYEEPKQSAAPPTIGSRPALTDIRPESHKRPKYRLAVTSPLTNADELLAALAAQVQPLTQPERWFSADDIADWITRRRIRNFILIVLAVLGTPLYVIVIGRIVASFMSFVK